MTRKFWDNYPFTLIYDRGLFRFSRTTMGENEREGDKRKEGTFFRTNKYHQKPDCPQTVPYPFI